MEYEHRDMQIIDTPLARSGRTIEEEREFFRQTPESHEHAKSFETAFLLAQQIQEQGGRAFVVGGAVRDEILGVLPKDFDLEVHGLTATDLERILAPHGVQEATGTSFGTYKLPAEHGAVELALPRRDSRTGDRHTDFTVDIVPDLGITEAARRREYTIGALYKDILTGSIYDPYHGIEDLESKTLRMVDRQTFSDDALRVLRGAGFAARFGLTVEAETMHEMQRMVEHIGALPKERLREEWTKILLKGKQPSLGIEVLREAGVFERWYPELEQLWSTPQDTEYHPEGDVGTHTQLVIDAASELMQREPLPRGENLELMYAALLHDVGKPITTKDVDGRIRALGHEAAGVKPAELFLDKLGFAPTVVRRITALVAEHMRPAALYRQREQISPKALRKLAFDIGPTHVQSLVFLAEADHRGRGPFVQPDGSSAFPDTTQYHAWWNDRMHEHELHRPPEPILWGRDLVESDRGWKASPLVGEAVRISEQLAINGVTREQVLECIDTSSTPEAALDRLRQLLETSTA